MSAAGSVARPQSDPSAGSQKLDPVAPVSPQTLAQASGEQRMDPSSQQIRDLEWRSYIAQRRHQGEGTALDPADHAPEDLTGIALSGGGIRSATFALGVLQALAKHDLLRRFDYLSTVSGGGYIGTSLTWLTSRTVTDRTLVAQSRASAAAPPVPPRGLGGGG